MVRSAVRIGDDREEHCPYVDAEEAQCASRLTMSRLEQAMSVCFDRYQTCPMYRRLSHRDREEFIVCTIERTDIGQPLRATGS